MALIVAVDVAAFAVAVAAWPAGSQPTASEWARWALLAVLAVGYAEATSRIELLRRYLSSDHGPMTTLVTVWVLPGALLLPLQLATLLRILIMLHVLAWTVRTASTPMHRTLFASATGVLATACASAIGSATGARAALWTLSWTPLAALGVLLAALAFTFVNAALVMAGMYAARRPSRLSALLLRRDDLALECATLVLGAFVAATLVRTPWLVPAIAGVMVVLQRSALVARLQEAATQDGKTGLLNAAAWEKRAQGEVHRAERDGTQAAVLLVDLDHFKSINDTHGHLAGDAALRTVAATLKGELRGHDVIARYGGEEFVVLLPGLRPRSAHLVAERLRARIETAHEAFTVTASIGVSLYPQHGAGILDLLAAADAALYRAKNAGRNCVCVA